MHNHHEQDDRGAEDTDRYTKGVRLRRDDHHVQIYDILGKCCGTRMCERIFCRMLCIPHHYMEGIRAYVRVL